VGEGHRQQHCCVLPFWTSGSGGLPRSERRRASDPASERFSERALPAREWRGERWCGS
jgi:hypothetical protein